MFIGHQWSEQNDCSGGLRRCEGNQRRPKLVKCRMSVGAMCSVVVKAPDDLLTNDQILSGK